MRAGSNSSSTAVQQTLTSEAASVLKHSLSLARRRGHAQITPLHVAATLLTSRLSLLRRACHKSYQQQPPISHHPSLQCRALELCFNVALNRLPTVTSVSGPVFHDQQPSLSNALVAALKRAQAHQRRGCAEQHQQQHQNVNLGVKVELEQLILSILDDPSVSRVMREAGFSSIAVKTNLEEECSVSSAVFQYCYNTGGIYSTPSSPPPALEIQPKESFINQNSILGHTHLLPQSSELNPFGISPQNKIQAHPTCTTQEDIHLVIEVLLRKKRRNCYIIGDSVSLTEGLVAELMGKVEKGDVPEELKHAQFIKFQCSSVASLRFMKKEEVESIISDLRRKVESVLATSGGGNGVIIHTGDLKWTIIDEDVTPENSGYNPVNHLIGEIGRLISCYSNSNAKVWVVATADYQTYMRRQKQWQSPLDIQWDLQVLFVPSAGLGLSLKAASLQGQKMAILPQTMSFCKDQKPFTPKEEPYNSLSPLWENHSSMFHQNYKPFSIPNHDNVNSNQTAESVPRFRRQKSCHIEFGCNDGNTKTSIGGEPNLHLLKTRCNEGKNLEEMITLSLGTSPVSEKSTEEAAVMMYKLLLENLPWQSGSIPVIVDALMMNSKEMKQKDTWILIQGNDFIGKRRLAFGISESLLGSTDNILLHINLRKKEEFPGKNCEMLKTALRDRIRRVVLLEDVDFSGPELLKFLDDGFRAGRIGTSCERSEGTIFILTKSDSKRIGDDDDSAEPDFVVQMEMLVSGRTSGTSGPCQYSDHKRKVDWNCSTKNQNKIPRKVEKENSQISANKIDLNIKAEEVSNDDQHMYSLSFLDLIKTRFTFNRDSQQDAQIKEMFLSSIRQSFEEVLGTKNLDCFIVEQDVLEHVSLGCGTFLQGLFEKWLKDIFQTSLKRINVYQEEGNISFRLCMKGSGGNGLKNGFKGSCLPNDVLVSFLD